MSRAVKLDLGCGGRKIAGAIGADVHPLAGVDVVCDLARFPYPFSTGSADEVHIHHVLEHMEDAVGMLAEIWRIVRDGGRVYIRVPHYTGPYAWKDPTHRRCFTSESFGYFGSNPYSYYTQARFQIESLRLRYFMEPPPRLVYRLWGRSVQWLLDRHPTFAERYLAYLVGGIDEIQVTLRSVKAAHPDVANIESEVMRAATLCRP